MKIILAKLAGRTSSFLVAVLLGLSGSPSALPASTGGIVGVHRIELPAGPNFVSIPFHGSCVLRSRVSAASGEAITFESSAGWSAGQLAPVDGFAQYFVIVSDVSAGSPASAGDWWLVVGNAADSVSLDLRGDAITAALQAGDTVEVRHLVSLRDVFGSGPTLRFVADSDFDVLSTQEDLIRFVSGTSFAGEVFYHDGTLGPAGYYANGERVGNGDGSTITIAPGEPFVFFRKIGAPALDLLVGGVVIATPFTHYLVPGANALGLAHPVPAPLATSALLEAGWISDTDFDVLSTQEDLFRALVGTSFAEEIFHYAGLDADPEWYVNGEPDVGYVFQPTRAYMVFRKGPSTLRWRQTLPFVP